VLAREEAIAESLENQMSRTNAPRATPAKVLDAVAETETALGRALTSDQREAILACCVSGRGAEILLGVAGAGKTTALRAMAEAFCRSGYRVIGTATSGQAARTLSEEAGIGFSRTLASVTWRLDHEMLELTSRDVVVLDEASMTDDAALLRLLGAAEGAGAKVLLVGDHLQLGPVGPGGAFEALLCRHRGDVCVLKENLRQHDPAERRALASLRAGEVSGALQWYLGHGRVRASETRQEALDQAVEAWSADYLSGRDVVLLSWRRANVAELNARARATVEAAGVLSGPEITAPGGRRYRAGDRVVLLAPVNEAGLVTSERATVLSVDERQMALSLLTVEGRSVCLAGTDISAERLDHAYAVTVHRMQGATTEVSHLYSDGGGRELAYVAMSRAREASFVYCVADDTEQAAEDLRREWSVSKRPRWVSDLGFADAPQANAPYERPELSPEREYALRLAHLVAQREAVVAAIPPDHSKLLGPLEESMARHRQELRDLEDGRGRFTETPVAEAAAERDRAAWRIKDARHQLVWAETRRDKRHWSKETVLREEEFESATERHTELAEPHRKKIEARIDVLRPRLEALEAQVEGRKTWLEEHPEALRRLDHIDHEIRERRGRLERHRRKMSGTNEMTPEERVLRQPRRPRSLGRDLDYYDRYHAPAPRPPERDAGRGLSR
jgi:hypothetical protein